MAGEPATAQDGSSISVASIGADAGRVVLPADRSIDLTDVDRRKALAGLAPEDLELIRTAGEIVLPDVDRFVAVFFDYLFRFEEAPFLGNHRMLEEAKRLKREHLVAMMQGDYGRDYAEQRQRLAMLYSRGNMRIRLFLGAFHHLLSEMGTAIIAQHAEAPQVGFQTFTSLTKVGFFDLGIIVDVMVAESERTIMAQQEAIRELSTPVIQLRERLLMLPIIGVIDTQRARQLTESLLTAIRANRAQVAVMDVTGVAAVDSQVANHLIQAVTAARLMGAHVIITGLSSEVAQALVRLGVDLGGITTMGDLQRGLEAAERQLGYRLVQAGDGAARPAP